MSDQDRVAFYDVGRAFWFDRSTSKRFMDQTGDAEDLYYTQRGSWILRKDRPKGYSYELKTDQEALVWLMANDYWKSEDDDVQRLIAEAQL